MALVTKNLPLLGLVVCLACGATEGGGSATDDLARQRDEERSLPELRRLGEIAGGAYLFPRDALGSGETYLSPGRLERVEADAFVIHQAGEGEQRLERTRAWPMLCLERPVQIEEADLKLHLEAGAPVLILASDGSAARVSVTLDTEHSRVVPMDALDTEACAPRGAGPSGDGVDGVDGDSARSEPGRVGATAEGDRACLYPDREVLDEAIGVPVPAGAELTVLEDGDEWSIVQVRARGARLQGWMASSLVEQGEGDGEADDLAWIGAALADRRCFYPGRPDSALPGEASVPVGEGNDPSISPLELQRVVRQGTPQIDACYEARRNAVPDLAVELEVSLLVDADGFVERARVTRGADADEALTECVLERVRRWRFPPPRVGSVQVRHTFDLQ